MMIKIESLEVENQETLARERAEGCTSEPTAEITPLPLECFHLVGGGDSITVLG
jgi:hypothetical protein